MEYLKISQAVQMTQLDRKTLYRFIQEGHLKASQLGKIYRIKKTDLEQFMEKMRVQA